ncbi:MAG: histidinol dehydrogenase [bacterium]|nr:histidinol dehydrogenase [bacterium]
MKLYRAGEAAFDEALERLTSRMEHLSPKVLKTVERILADVQKQGDKALVRYTERFDGLKLSQKELRVAPSAFKEARRKVGRSTLRVLEVAAERIEAYHRRQVENGWFYQEGEEISLGLMVRPLRRVGLYVPGGKAAYPSTVLMSAIPARVAGVEELAMCVPSKTKRPNPVVLAAAQVAGIEEVYRVGGAQAIAALAYGTETVSRVDKIVGPGNVYVVAAKRAVFGVVDIDMLAGPSEIVVVADESADAAFVAADLLSQLEHDELAVAVLMTPSETLAREVQREVATQKRRLKRKRIINAALKGLSAIFVVEDLRAATEAVNAVAPEHLELAVEEPLELLPLIENAGAVFLGHYTPEAVGDYLAGPSHVLPTSGTARFASPLGVYDFLKRSSVISTSREALKKLAKPIIALAELEGLDAHAESVRRRMRSRRRRG